MSKSTSIVTLAGVFTLFRVFLLKVKGQCLRTKRPGNFKTQSMVNIYCVFRATAKLVTILINYMSGEAFLKQCAIFTGVKHGIGHIQR